MERRDFLRLAGGAGALAALGSLGVLGACGRGPGTATIVATSTPMRRSEPTRYGALSGTPDANGLLLPAGFRSDLLAVGGELVPGTLHTWHPFPDGGACFALDDGGWIYVSNSEVPYEGLGGAGALRFDRDGRVIGAHRVLDGTTMNCAGGSTPWGTWLSCEEFLTGRVWECDPTGRATAEPRPAMGWFRHEAVAADPAREVLYLSEDERDGLLYRFRPRRWTDLSDGELEALAVADGGRISWVPVAGTGVGGPRTRYAAPGATILPGAEGIALDGDALFIATKHDHTIRRLDLDEGRLATHAVGPPIDGPDNLAVHPASGNLFVCEDGGDMEVVVVTPEGDAAPFLRFLDHERSEVAGAAFDPSGGHLVVSSQRAPTPRTLSDLVDGLRDGRPLGRTYMITGPF